MVFVFEGSKPSKVGVNHCPVCSVTTPESRQPPATASTNPGMFLRKVRPRPIGRAYTASSSDWSVRSLAHVHPALNSSPLLRRLFAATCSELYFWLAPFSNHVMVLKFGFGSLLISKGVVLGGG